MGANERIARAQISGNLADNDMRLSDVDFVRASGMAAQTNPEGLMLYRLKYANDHTEYKATLRRVYALAVGKAFRMRKTIRHEELMELAESTLRHWIAPVCPVCLGRGYAVIPGTPTLSESACKHCYGGHLPLQRAVKAHLDLAEWLASRMDAVTGEFVSSAKRHVGI